jgi:hypothetical protein
MFLKLLLNLVIIKQQIFDDRVLIVTMHFLIITLLQTYHIKIKYSLYDQERWPMIAI